MNPTMRPTTGKMIICVGSNWSARPRRKTIPAKAIAVKPFTPRKNSVLVLSMPSRFSFSASAFAVFAG